jgi:hypothetical protein
MDRSGCKRTMWELCVRGGEGDSQGVYLVRVFVLSLSFVKPNKRERPTRPDEPNPRYAPRYGFWFDQDTGVALGS